MYDINLGADGWMVSIEEKFKGGIMDTKFATAQKGKVLSESVALSVEGYGGRETGKKQNPNCFQLLGDFI